MTVSAAENRPGTSGGDRALDLALALRDGSVGLLDFLSPSSSSSSSSVISDSKYGAIPVVVSSMVSSDDDEIVLIEQADLSCAI